MKSRRAFTLMEVLVVISIIALLMAILVPALGLARRTANNMRSQTQLKSIQNSFVIYAEGNNDWYPGLSNQGFAAAYDYFLAEAGGPDSEDVWAAGGPSGVPSAELALWLLLRDAYLTPEDLVSPSDDSTLPFVPQSFDGNNRLDVDDTTGPPPTGLPVDTWNSGYYSYATLELANSTLRTRLWRANGNAQLPIASDRAIDNDADGGAVVGGEIMSIHTNPGPDQDDWDGFIVWNDGHVTRDINEVTTRLTESTPNSNDDLFDVDEFSARLRHNPALGEY